MPAPPDRHEQRISWGALYWAMPLAYVFVDPLRQHAQLLEWLLTTLALTLVLALYVIGVSYIKRPRLVVGVAGMILGIAIGFVMFRPGGAIFFPVAAAFAPFIVQGRLPHSALLVAGVAGVFGLTWWLCYPDRMSLTEILPWAIAAETMLVGGGTTYAARQNRVVERTHRAIERERIARDLHDLLGHSLACIALKSELASRILHQDPQRALAEFHDVERISRRALEEVQHAIRGYHAGDMQTELELAGSMLEVAGVTVQCHCELGEIDPGAERVLALVLREAVTNVVRHAQASMCRVLLARQQGSYRLEIHDNGCGGVHDEGVGMRSIRARVETAGGSVRWDGGDGMLLTVILPSPVQRA